MDKEKVIYIYISHKEECYSAIKKNKNHAIFKKMGGNGDHYIKQNKPDSEKEVSHFLSYREPRGAIK
jgi:hypothetical protein